MSGISERPGYQTTEFWLSLLAVILSALLASGILGAGSAWEQAASAVVAGLAALGYAGSRAAVKRAESLRRAAESASRPPT